VAAAEGLVAAGVVADGARWAAAGRAELLDEAGVHPAATKAVTASAAATAGPRHHSIRIVILNLLNVTNRRRRAPHAPTLRMFHIKQA
jgi:hypothetical protein